MMKMKILCLCLTILITMSCISCDLYDDLKSMDFKDPEKVVTYVKCLTDDDGCSPDFEEKRKSAPEILSTCCSKCSFGGKMNLIHLMALLIDKNEDVLTSFFRKHDPELKSAAACQELVKSELITLAESIPGYLKTCCAKCPGKVKNEMAVLLNAVIEIAPQDVKAMLNEHDPVRKYISKCNEQFKAFGLDLSQFLAQ